ncbi:MAG: bifunctional diaminohydroxyphosphoribosylaminopyrimidine deaminase/5-amino-6-(5-phosphoribosylamino)uracil reductase RibD [Cyanobacteria bacterium P01_F01_bin.150]
MDTQQIDQAMIQRCLQLAKQALGKTSPNPLVGAVVVKDNKIVGEGFHPGAGQPHAEVFALQQAGDRAQNSTVYVNLEPCNHQGRTPPCSEALIKAGVARVVVGMVDPNPKVAGSGIERLRKAGIDVLVGVEEVACQQLNEAFVHSMVHQRPFGILKYAMTLDGKIAATSGHSAWVTSPEARQQVHYLRAACDAIVVGGNTVRQDNPLLTSHGVGTHNPLRVVMSRTLDLPDDAQLWQTDETSTVVFTSKGRQPWRQKSLRTQGVEVIEVETLTPAVVMANLHERGFLSVLWECGGKLAAQAIADGSIQKILAFIAPKLIGGNMAPGPVGDLGLTRMDEAIAVERLRLNAIGSDYLVSGYLKRD